MYVHIHLYIYIYIYIYKINQNKTKLCKHYRPKIKKSNVDNEKPALVWDITQRIVVISYRRFGTTSATSSGYKNTILVP